MTIVYAAARILTQDPRRPFATHVAVDGGRILGAGSLAELKGLGALELDERYAGKVLMPGLVEGHAHLMEGGMWSFVYCGYHDRTGPDGRRWTGLKSFDAVVERLAAAEVALPQPQDPLVGWGFDPIHFGDARMTVRELDRVSTRREVVLMHASMHLMNVNGAMLRRAQITRDTPIQGIAKMADGEPSGELQEFAAMYPVFELIGSPFQSFARSEAAIRDFGRIANRAGVTTITDLVSELDDASIDVLARVTADADFPVRIVPALGWRYWRGSEGLAQLARKDARSHDKLRLGAVKLVVDGSIQGFTARLRAPGYHNGAPNGLWVIAPQEVDELVGAYHAAGRQLHIHTNGDEATDVALDALERALAQHPRPDHRHTLQHCQMADEAQFRRMKALDVCVNLFANHVYYWGDAHYATTLGPARANRMDACATAQRIGVPWAIHSDAPITPVAPLFTAWCAVTRATSGGRVLGAGECVTVPEALHAITMGAAYTLKLEREIGSIEAGKRADFAVLEEDPLECPPERLRDIRVCGTVLGGRHFPASS